ncbi:MAG TPA: class I SAM-dependent methyltransferase [Kofleriaceae bacterium]|nr:class I SAM-dependent methyltransferase [Kofleriaceae bacterium]
MGLSEQEDAYGRAILDFYEGKGGFEIFELDDGFIDVAMRGGLPAFYFSPFDRWFAHEKEALQLLRGRVLDIGCGAGRHCLYSQERGHDVIGIDNSPLAIEVAKRRGVRDARVLSIGDIGPALGVFDTLLMLGSNFALFQSRAIARTLLQRFHEVTAPDAQILAGVMDPHHGELAGYCARNVERDPERMPGQLRMRIRYKGYATPWFDSLNVSKTELASVIDGTGWVVDRFIGDHVFIAVLTKQAR